MTTVYLDIETIPSQLPWVNDYVSATVKPPGTIKKAESLLKWEQENRADAVQEALDKCGFDGALNHIICIGVAIDDAAPVAITANTPDQETDLLKAFYELIGGLPIVNTFVGHNISGFDMRVIKQRSMVLGVKPCKHIPFEAKPWERNPFDTMIQWDNKNSAKLDKIARAMGFEGKGEIDGSDVYPLWKAGEFEKIAQYCKDDVELTRNVYKKMIAVMQ